MTMFPFQEAQVVKQSQNGMIYSQLA